MANNCNKTFRDLINDGQAQVLGIVSIVPMGDWNGTTTYQKLNYVRHNGATYLAKVANNNVEPRVAANWEDVWMLCNYDGGLVVPDGTYPDLTAGQVLYPLSFGSKTYNGSSAQTVTAADLGVASAYIPQGSITFANLPSTPSAATLSYVWDISDQFTTDSRFIEGAGQTYSAGTNVGVIEQNGNYYYDVFGSFVDLSNYAQINGTYSGMTVGKATQADNATAATDAAKLGGVVAENYAQINGTYSGMTVGAATKATQDGSGNNIVGTYARQNGTYPNMTVGNATNAVKATQDSNGNNIADTYAQKNNLLVAHYITVDLANTFHFVCTLINKSTTPIGSKSTLLQVLQNIGNSKGVVANGFLLHPQKGGVIFEIIALSSTTLRIRTVATPDVGSVNTFDYDIADNAIVVGDVVVSY